MDETYIKVNGKWVYLYRAIDSCGDTIEFLLRKRRDAASAKAFFRKAFRSNDIPKKVVIDKSSSNTSALTEFNQNLPKEHKIKILQNKYLNNLIEQDHNLLRSELSQCLVLRVSVVLRSLLLV